MIRALDLFSGIGGFALGLQMAGGFETLAFCENAPFCQAVLREHWPDVPIMPDIREVKGDTLAALGQIDMVCGGPPCQAASVAGKRRGESDDRWLWPDFLRVVREVRPAWVLAENPRGIVSLRPRGLAWIISELESAGYETSVHLVGAHHVGAPHKRERVWIVANTEQHGCGAWGGIARDEEGSRHRWGESPRGVQLAHSAASLPSGRGASEPGRDTLERIAARWPSRPGERQHDWERPRLVELRVGQSVDGIPDGLVQVIAARTGWAGARCEKWWARNHVRLRGLQNKSGLRALGNAVVPQVVAVIGRAIMEASRC